MRTILLVMVLFLCWGAAGTVAAHESQPGSLEIRELAANRYDITWRAPLYYGKPHPARLQLPESWRTVARPTERRGGESIVHHMVVQTGKNTTEGEIIGFPGLEATITDIFIRLTRLDGTVMNAVARPTKPWAALRGERSWQATAGEYLGLGLHHILMGVDHLLFVLGLLLIVRGRMMLLKTITSFTVAHSITLALATLGYAHVPLEPLNAAIALSILFLGPEVMRARHGDTSLTTRFPWLVAFAFGLLHGFGFASGLAVAGMPAAELPWALLWFNIGVESGQLVFVFLALALAWSFRTLEVRWPSWTQAVPAYTVGGLGAYWTIDRTLILLKGLM